MVSLYHERLFNVKKRLARNGKKIFPAFLIFLCIYVLGASVQAFHVNTDMAKADQLDYLSRAISLKTDLYKNIADGNRMPVYLYLLSFLYHPGLPMEEYFQRGKIFNIILSVLLLSILYVIFRIYLDGKESETILLITGFTVFMPRAGYIQCELLFYFLNFCAFMHFWGCLQKPRFWMAVRTGLLAGLGYLTKASVLPAVAWFVVCYFIASIAVPIYKEIVNKINRKLIFGQNHIIKNVLFLGVFILIFLMTVSPYIRMNNKVFGHYFYNVNSTFYIWYDSWDEVVQGTRAHGDRVGWPQMPSEEIPSATKYWQEHNLSQILVRLAHGFITITTNAMVGLGYAQYFCIYLFIGVLAIIKRYEAFDEYLKRDNNLAVAISLVSYFLLYFLLYIFGAAIFKGPRHLLAQYLPALFILFYFLTRFGFSYYSQKIKCQITMREIHIVVFWLLVLDLMFHLPYKLYVVFAGW
jgi:hypothetical protein